MLTGGGRVYLVHCLGFRVRVCVYGWVGGEGERERARERERERERPVPAMLTGRGRLHQIYGLGFE